MENKQEELKVPGVPVDAVVAYLNDLYRQLDAISFNIRTNISHIQPKVDGEVTNGNNES